MKQEYHFNEHGTCTNPTHHTFKCSKKYTAVIKLAQLPNGKWVYGMGFIGQSQGFEYGCSLHEPNSNQFDSKSACYESGVAWMIQVISGRGKIYQRLVEILEMELRPVPIPEKVYIQLDLF